jgi:hypothetical protein
MFASPRRSWRLAALFGCLAAGLALTSLPGPASAGDGEWGIVRQSYLYDDCIYAVFVSNQLSAPIKTVRLRTQFFDGDGKSLGTYNLSGETNIEPFATDVVGWKIDSICKSVEEARILKSAAGF